jgi:hypothetical protein
MIADFTEAIVFGDWNSFQVPISMIGRATGLSFGVLQRADTMGPVSPTKKVPKRKGKKQPARGGRESIGGQPILLDSPADAYLG